MRLAAASDVHAPENLEEFGRLIDHTEDFDVMLLAGDVVKDDDLDRYGDALDLLPPDAEIYGVFGNQEYAESQDEYVSRYGDRIHFLRETTVDLDGLQIVGTTGSLDRPTWWQRTNRPELWRIYAERVNTVDKLLGKCSRAVLLTHYSPTYRTLKGEERDAWPEMGRQGYEELIERHSDKLVAAIHGHAHSGEKRAEVAGVPIINAAVSIYREGLPVINV